MTTKIIVQGAGLPFISLFLGLKFCQLMHWDYFGLASVRLEDAILIFGAIFLIIEGLSGGTVQKKEE